MRFQASIQILLLIIAVVIVFTVIRPKFAEIQFNQDEIVGYQLALSKAGEYNQRLNELFNRANSIPASQRTDLNRYLPVTLDPTEISRDIENIVNNNELLLVELSATESSDVTVTNPDGEVDDTQPEFVQFSEQISEGTSGLIAQRFSFNAIGTYDQLKTLLQDLERNAYPLRLVELNFQAAEDTPLNQYSITLESYALKRSQQ